MLKKDTACYRANELRERNTISIKQQTIWRYQAGPTITLSPFYSAASSYIYK